MSQLLAIIFDMDGTLVNTFNHTERAYALAMKTFGIRDMSSNDFRMLYEKNVKTAEYLKHFGIDLSHVEDFRRIRDKIYLETLREKIEWIEGAEEMLKNLQGKFPLAIATGAQKQYIDAIHERLGLLDFMTTVVSADDIGYKRKPDPFTLLRAAELLGIEPQSALYIGDQFTDIRAAKMAKMKSALFSSPSTTPSDATPDFFVHHLSEIPEKILSTLSVK